MSSSEGSTRPPTQASFDTYEPYVPPAATNGMTTATTTTAPGIRQSDDQSFQPAKYSQGTSLPQPYTQLPQITPRSQYPDSTGQPQYPKSSAYPKNPHTVDNTKTNYNSDTDTEQLAKNGHRPSRNQTHPYTSKTPNDLRQKLDSDSNPTHLDHPPAISARRAHNEKPQEEYRAPLSATPPASPNSRQNRDQYRGSGRGQNQDRHREDNRGHNRDHSREHIREQKSHPHSNEDSGITGLTPDETQHGNHNDVLDRRKNEADLNGEPRVQTPEKSGDHERNQAWATERLTDRDRQNHTEMGRRRLEEENQANSEMNEKNFGDDDVKETKADSDDDTTQYPSPPPLRLSSPGRDTESAKENRRKQKDLLSKELEEVMVVRRDAERQREELVKQAKHMQNNMQNKRNHARDIWKKRYFEEKRKTGPFEEQCTRLRHELDIIHKKLLSTLEGPKEKATKLTDMKPPSHKNNFKIQATRLQHQIEDVRQRVDYAKMKLTGEMKLRNQAETELRALRAELTQKKINLTLSRNSQLTAYAPPASDVKLYQTLTARHGITPHS